MEQGGTESGAALLHVPGRWQAQDLSDVIRRTEAAESGMRIGGGDVPIAGRPRGVAPVRPCRDLPRHRVPVGQPLAQALAGRHAQLRFGHVQPRPCFSGSDAIPAARPVAAPRAAGMRHTARRSRACSADRTHQHDPLGIGVVDIDQLLDAVGSVDPGALPAALTWRQPRNGSVTRKRLATPPRTYSGSWRATCPGVAGCARVNMRVDLRVDLRAKAVPELTRRRSWARPSSVSVTRYGEAMAGDLLWKPDGSPRSRTGPATISSRPAIHP